MDGTSPVGASRSLIWGIFFLKGFGSRVILSTYLKCLMRGGSLAALSSKRG